MRSAACAVVLATALTGCSQLFFGPASGPMRPSDWLMLVVITVFVIYATVTAKKRP